MSLISVPRSERTALKLAILAILCHCSVFAISRKPMRSTLMSLRGGDNSTNTTNMDLEHRSTKRSPGWLISSLFRLSDETKVAASKFLPSEETNITGRGGAVAPRQKPKRERVDQPLDTSKVGTLSSRLIKDDNITMTTNDTAVSPPKALTNKLWWSTAWSMHSSMTEKEEKDMTNTSNTDSEIDLTIDINASKIEDFDQKQVTETPAPAKKTKKQKLKKKKSKRRSSKKEKSTNFDVVTQLIEEPHVANFTQANVTSDYESQIVMEPEANLTSSESQYLSSGHWRGIDALLSLSLAKKYPKLRVSRSLRGVRKLAANLTGLHGFLSGKGRLTNETQLDEQSKLVRRKVAAIERARKQINKMAAAKNNSMGRFGIFGRQKGRHPSFLVTEGKLEEIELEKRRKARVQAIDREMSQAQQRLQELACEKDVLQRRLNPLWNYTTQTAPLENGSNATRILGASRDFNFPPHDLVEDYLDMLFYSGRIVKLNHTDLWRNVQDEDDEDDELVSDSEQEPELNRGRRSGSGAGTWLLRNGLGEKLGQTVETAGYKAVGGAIMSVLARSLSAIHGINIMKHTDIRLSVEQTPDLPPVSMGIIPGSGPNGNYAQHALHDIMQRGSKRHGQSGYGKVDSDFIQKEAIVETLLSHCQISAPLLTLFPIAWQRALLGNLIILITAVVADFASGLEFHILGHCLTFSFTPITEEDMIRKMGLNGLDRREIDPNEFEEAVKATAEDLSEELRFLDKWHERVLGGGLLRAQIANLIARLVLTLVGDILADARMDFWTAHAGGPRLMADLEFRTTSRYMDEPTEATNSD